jgi:tetratricopeptide (TPR) repeat protein
VPPRRGFAAGLCARARRRRWRAEPEGASRIRARLDGYNLGVALLRLKQYKETVDALTAAHESTVPRKKLPAGVRVPHDVDADYLHALGTAYQERREFHKSLACFEAAVAADAAHLKSHYARALTLEAQGELIAARMAWIEYLSRDADSAWGEGARHHLAEVERLLKAESETQTP